MMITIGQCFDSLNAAPIGGMKAISRIYGKGAPIRWSIYTNRHALGPDLFDWARTDADMEAFVAADLTVMVNPMWLPRWMTGGLPVNEPYASAWDEKRGWHQWTIEEKPFFYYPNFPPIDKEPVRAFGAALGKRYGSQSKYGKRVTHVSFWNEPDIGMYFPQKDSPPSWYEAMRILYEVWGAFMRGWLSESPDTPIVGWDCATPGNLDLFGRLEREYVAKDRTWPVVSVLSGHMYGEKPVTIEGSLREIKREGGWLDVWSRYALGRELWNTEYADVAHTSAATNVELTARLVEEVPQVTRHFTLTAGQWLSGGVGAWDRGQFDVSSDGWQMAGLCRGLRAMQRRRSVRT